MMKMRKTKQEKLKADLKRILGDGPLQFEVTKDSIVIRNDKGDQIFALKGIVKVDTKLRECERCKEVDDLEAQRKDISLEREQIAKFRKQLDGEHVANKLQENMLKDRQEEIRKALKTLCQE